MEDRLPSEAERFLRRLDKALWPLSSAERESILLELRCHLLDRAGDGMPLAETLAALGSPEGLASGFTEAAMIEGSSAPAPAQLSGGAEAPRRRMSFAEVASQVRSTRLASRNGLFTVGAVLVTMLTGTNYLAWADRLMHYSSLEAWPAMVLRGAVALLAAAAAYRIILTDDRRPWALSLATLRFSAAQLGVLAFTFAGVAATLLAARELVPGAGAAGGAARLAVMLAAVAFFSCAAFRVQPWVAALAIGRCDVTLKASWHGTGRRLGDIVRGWVALVLPLYILHFALTLAALRILPLGPGHLALAAFDAVAATGAMLAAVLLNATVFRWVAGESIPAPRPFSTEAPNGELVGQARRRLRLLVEASARDPRHT